MAEKRQLSITVQGTRRKWCFDILADPAYLDEWRADGLVVEEVVNTIHVWAVDAGLAGPWCFLQDVFHWKNPFR